MSLRTALQRDFSPYEIAVLGYVLSYGFGIAGMILFASGRTGGGLLLWLATPIVWLVFREFSRCPQCAKDPMERSSEGVHWFLLYVYPKYRFRFWPERECSECRFQLDDQPPLDKPDKRSS